MRTFETRAVKWHSEELHYLCSSANTITVTKSGGNEVGKTRSMHGLIHTYKFSVGELERKITALDTQAQMGAHY
jgi:hypothetical protein